MAIVLPQGKQQFFDSNGDPLVGGLLHTYQPGSGSTTPKNTWSDAAATALNTNPIVLNARGEATIFWSGGYNVRLETAAGGLIYTVEDVNIDPSAATLDAALRADLASTADLAKGDALIGHVPRGTGASGRTVRSLLLEFDHSTNFATLILAAASGIEGLVITADATVSANLTFAMPVRIAPGIVLTIATGVTLNFNGGFEASIEKHFICQGTGVVRFAFAKTVAGYPEWWGALPNDSSGTVPADNVTALNHARDSLPWTILQQTDYYISSVLKWNVQYRKLTGAGCHYNGAADQVTRLIGTTATMTVLQLGPDAQPATLNDFYQGLVVKDIFVTRALAPDVTSNATGVLYQFTLYADLDNVKSAESIYCWNINGNVKAIAGKLWAQRSTRGTIAGVPSVQATDKWYGFYQNGNSAITAINGNASTFLHRPNSAIGGILIDNSACYYVDGAFTDTFWFQPESVGASYGVHFVGDGSTSNTDSNRNFHIIGGIFDAATVAPVRIQAANRSGAIYLEDIYGAPASGATAGIYIVNSFGVVMIQGGELAMSSATTTVGINIDTSPRVHVKGTTILEATAGGVAMTAATNCVIEPVITNFSKTLAYAVQPSGACAANRVAPTVSGLANKVTLGINVVGTTDVRNEYNCTGIDSGCINGGSGNKLLRNAVQITATGLSGTNLVSGVMT